MGFKKKFKKAFRNIVGDFTGVQWGDLDHKKVYGMAALLLAVILLIVVLIVSALTGGGEKKKKKTQDSPVTVQEEKVPEDPAEEDAALKEDAYPEINELVTKYFNGLSSGDVAMVAETVDVLTDEEKRVIERKKDYIESYNNITCYTKEGPEEGTYVVFAAYEMKLYNIEAEAPGIMALYVCPSENGGFYIFNGEAPEELENYVLELAADEEVAAVIADVDARYQQMIAEDEELGKFASAMLQSQEEQTEDQQPEAPGEEAGATGEPVSTVVTDTVRLREGRSTESSMLDTLAAGTGVKVLKNYSDGWSKIEYNGTTGYCKTEFLENTEGVPTEEVQEEAGGEPQQPAEASEATPVNKVMQLKEAVRIRAERSADSERVASAYQSELVTVIENYSDGWSKVKYNDVVGYCKTEFLQEAQ